MQQRQSSAATVRSPTAKAATNKPAALNAAVAAAPRSPAATPSNALPQAVLTTNSNNNTWTSPAPLDTTDAGLQPTPTAGPNPARMPSPAAQEDSAAAADTSVSSKASRHFRSATLADSSDLDDTTSSDISSSVGAAADSSALQQIGLEFDDEDSEQQREASGRRFSTSSLERHQQQLQQQRENGHASRQQREQQQHTGPGPGGQVTSQQCQQQQGQDQQQRPAYGQQGSQQQEQSSSAHRRTSSSGRTRGAAGAGKARAAHSDPDYEVPQGKLTETQVLLSHADKLHLDRYGFIVTEAEAAARAARAKRTPGQVKRDQRHVQKWRRMLGSSRDDFMAYWGLKPKKVKRRVRKGIPDEFRGLVWQYLSGGRELMQQHPGHYAQLLTTTNDSVDMEIMRDLNRTFPNHVFFHQRQGPGQQSLFHVLRAYSAHDRLVGYVQGMGFVTAILLMYMSEEEAFWTLVALLKGSSAHPPLEGLYQAGMPLLQQCLFQFQELLKQENPKLGGHLEQEGVVPSMYCTHWFNTIFAYSLPFEQLLRVWDVFLLEGMKVVFRVGIVLLGSAQDQLVAMPFEKLVAALNGRKFPVLNRPPDSLMRAALRISVSRRLELLRERYQQQTAAAEAAAAAAAGGSGDGGSSHNTGGSNGGHHHHAVITPVTMGPSR